MTNTEVEVSSFFVINYFSPLLCFHHLLIAKEGNVQSEWTFLLNLQQSLNLVFLYDIVNFPRIWYRGGVIFSSVMTFKKSATLLNNYMEGSGSATIK